MHTPSDQITPRDGSAWLDHPDGRRDDPWRMSSDDQTSQHAAFIGNGLIGCRIGEDGDALHPVEGSGSLMAGFWGTSRNMPARSEAQVDLPRWAGFALHLGDQREQNRLRQRQQELDLRSCTVTTTGVVDGAQVRRCCWLARADKHIAVFSATITNTHASNRPLRVETVETFDATDMEAFDLQSADADEHGLRVLGRERRLGAQLGLASRMLFEPADDTSIKTLPLRTEGRRLARRHRFWLQPGEQICITRLIALAHDGHGDQPLQVAIDELARAVADPSALRQRHESAWNELWRHRISVDHPRLQRVLNASLYYLYASLRADEPHSHGPAGLTNDAWDGTVFWDTELWTLPPLALLQPPLALACARYRANTLEGALANARDHGEAGARFAWQSAASGRECCVRPVFVEERHIVSCVARGQWLAMVAAGDVSYRDGPGWAVIRACADYWVSRIVMDTEGSAHINQVCGPDEDAGLVDDNAMTNASAAWTLRLAHRLAEERGDQPDPRWLTLAKALVIPWDHERDIPLQMVGWQHGQTIKQADAALLIHPWQYPLDDAAKQRTVDYYRAHYPENQIMMGVAIDAVIDCQIQRAQSAWDSLGQLMPHLHEPYLWVTEAPNNEKGCFLTGIGGLLQLVLQGFAGVSVDDDERLQVNPCMPAELTSLTVHGLCHNGATHTLHVQRTHDTIHQRLEQVS